jgi:hypothetical protein
MSSTITVFDTYNRPHVITDTAISLSITSGVAHYDNGGTDMAVDYLLAELESGDASITAFVAGTSLEMNNIRGTANAANVTSHLSWATVAGGVNITITRPATTGQVMEWSIGDGVPPVKLRVKIARK